MADDWERLADHVRGRRADLGLTQGEVSAAGGPSISTQRFIEGARQPRYSLRTLRRLEDALGWERGSARRILDGGDPVPAPPAVTTGTAAAAGAATATATAQPAEPAPLTRIGQKIADGQAIAEEMFEVVDEVWSEIRDARRRGIPEGRIFAEPDEQAWWSMRVTSEDQRAANIAALRYWRRTLPPRRNNSSSGRATALAG